MSKGIIFHWGLYSVGGYDSVSSARRRRMQNGSEWYLKRLTEKGDYRPISGWKETQKYHKENFGDDDYYTAFTPVFEKESKKCDFKEWMEVAKNYGASYVIITSKHHDGYCLWKGKKDLILDFCNTARLYNLKVGIYYSWSEFGKSITIKYLNEVIKPQMEELKKYKPDIWWFDGHWDIKTKIAKDTINNIVKSLKGEINDRIPDKSLATFYNHEDRYLPEEKLDYEWESIQTIGLSWGYNRDQKKSDYKTHKDIVKLEKKVSKLGGRFLINLGPRPDGSLVKEEVNALVFEHKKKSKKSKKFLSDSEEDSDED
jgi:alpha-L-fucosidase